LGRKRKKDPARREKLLTAIARRQRTTGARQEISWKKDGRGTVARGRRKGMSSQGKEGGGKKGGA